MLRVAVIALLTVQAVTAQFFGLSANHDGSELHFISTLRLKGSDQPLNGKAFVARADGSVRLFAARASAQAPSGESCSTGGFEGFYRAEASASDLVTLEYVVQASGWCLYPPNRLRTALVSLGRTVDLPGLVRMSSNGQHGVIFLAGTGRPGNPIAVRLLDRRTGLETPVDIAGARLPFSGTRTVSDDGTAIVPALNAGNWQGYLARPGQAPAAILQSGLPLAIDRAGTRVVYYSDGLREYKLAAGESRVLAASQDIRPETVRLSDDGGRVLFATAAGYRLLDTRSMVELPVAAGGEVIVEASLSGDGNVIFAATAAGRLLRMDLRAGELTELIGRTPYVQPFPWSVRPGFATWLYGAALDGDVAVSVAGRGVPLFERDANAVRFLVPWDAAPAGGTVRVALDAPAGRTPFDRPEVDLMIEAPRPQAGAIARENWETTFLGPVRTGEIIHVFAAGLGGVTPEVPLGEPAPAAEPLARLSRPLQCQNADVLYAGLAPQHVERVYQVDLRITAAPGYQRFTCMVGDSEPFTLVALLVE